MHPLPPYARRVEYLESTGTQWIDTGVVPSSDWSIAVTCSMIMNPTQSTTVWTARSITEPRCTISLFLVYNNQEKPLRFDYGYNQQAAQVAFLDYEHKHEYKNVGGRFYIDGVLYDTIADEAYECGGPLRIFAAEDVNNPGNIVLIASGKIYGVCVKNASGILVRSFVPCRILDTGYLWDEVEGKFYGNSGTGDFVLGPDVREGVVPTRLNPFGVGRRQEEIRRVEYLESTGKQYVDTGVTPPASPRIEMTVMPINRARILDASYYSRDGAYRNFGVNIPPRGAISLHYNASTAGSDIVIDNGGVSFLNTVVSFTADGNSFTAFGTTKTDSSWTIEPGSSCTIGMFARHVTLRDGTEKWESLIKMRIYSCRIYDGSTLVRNFVPVAIGSTGYLLDRVSGRLFGNQGTGSFVLGPDFVPRLRVWGNGQNSSLFDISTPYPLAAGNPVTGTVNGDARSGILASDLYTVNDAGGDYVGEFIDMTPGGTDSPALRWFDRVAGSPFVGYCEIVQ